MTRIHHSAAKTTQQYGNDPDRAHVEHSTEAGKASSAHAAKKTAAPTEHMSKAQRAAVDGLVKRHSAKTRFEATRAALTKNPGLADHYVGLRLRGLSKVEHRIVHAVLARSGTTGMQRLAMCESALRQIQHLGPSRRADVMALVEMGASVHSAIAQLESDGQADKAEAAAKSRHSMAHKLDAAVKSLKHEASHWKKTADEVNALYRKVPRLSREAEVITGVVNLEVDIADDLFGALQAETTGNTEHLRRAVLTAGRNVGHVTGRLSKKVDQARTLYMQFAKQHAAYVEQNNRMQRAIQSGDFAAQTDARDRMNKLAAGMKRTVAEFRPLAKKVAELDHELDKAIKHGTKGALEQAAFAGLPLPGKEVVEEHAGKAVSSLYESTIEGAVTTTYESLTHSFHSE